MIRAGIVTLIVFVFSLNASAQQKKVRISTNLGDMVFVLYDDTPKHRDAFLQLTEEGYYNETLFYRVIQDFLIQGGSKSSKNAAPGKRIGYGDPDKTVDDEILPHHFHKKGALCAPRQPDEVNPWQQSDISQFYVVKGSVYTSGQLDTMELAVNRPIRNRIVNKYLNDEARAQLKELKEEKKVEEFRELASQIRQQIETDYNLQTDVLEFSEDQRKAYATVGGYPDLDGKYTVFGECISGLETIDKIAALKTDENDRPFTDVKITVTVLNY
ncbi:peptidylprolyl isomerase/peptidyl-prolyl cis-trans isomerase B (cyclophilin B) [Mariniphaga anaerophila]|uniref:peptidylprolyl isomerase n=1 Tax=Mariniphaga anaerophila TaxID=1484053 RepID=A0A1M5BPL0_9BACT|nr:peptidylprolyl isomerase [Mariniphaga anaerophila]SHF44429.1 peptidylprolyl isomerase/peptidyl-prolyl cis-trans isomerase B (cyclophilin B) [Mariniphaga anaerophila]